MSPSDVADFIRCLERFGIVFVRGGEAQDLAVVDQFMGPTTPVSWLEFERTDEGYSHCWMPAHGRGVLCAPAGWTPEQSRGLNVARPGTPGYERMLEQTERAAPGVIEVRPFGNAEVRFTVSEASPATKAREWADHARELEKHGEHEKALAALRHMVELIPEDGEAREMLAKACARAGRWDEALAAAEEAMRLLPADARAAMLIGKIEERRGEPRRALAAYRNAARLAPDDAEAWYCCGVMHTSLGEIDLAIAAYAECLERDPRHEMALCNQGGTLVEQGRFEEGLRLLDAALAIDPDDIFAWWHHAHAQRGLRDAAGAAESLREVVRRGSERAGCEELARAAREILS